MPVPHMEVLLIAIFKFFSWSVVRPEFGQVLAIKAGKHPILEIVGHKNLISNDVYSALGHNFHIITGANMVHSTFMLW